MDLPERTVSAQTTALVSMCVCMSIRYICVLALVCVCVCRVCAEGWPVGCTLCISLCTYIHSASVVCTSVCMPLQLRSREMMGMESRTRRSPGPRWVFSTYWECSMIHGPSLSHTHPHTVPLFPTAAGTRWVLPLPGQSRSALLNGYTIV